MGWRCFPQVSYPYALPNYCAPTACARIFEDEVWWMNRQKASFPGGDRCFHRATGGRVACLPHIVVQLIALTPVVWCHQKQLCVKYLKQAHHELFSAAGQKCQCHVQRSFVAEKRS